MSRSKPRLVEFFLGQVPFATASIHCGGARFVALANTRPIEFLLYLYFGKTEDDLKNFALRDLGLLRTNTASSFSARFNDADEARACFHYSQLLDRLDAKSESVFRGAIGDVLSGPACISDYPPTCAAAPRVKLASSLKSWARAILHVSFIEPARRRRVTSGSSG